MLKKLFFGFALIFSVVVLRNPVSADEGMWLLNSLPVEYLKSVYNFTVTGQWIERVQKSSARLPNCSSSFVSSDGLLMTNWHCSEEAVKALSTPQNNYYENGFYAARNFSEELKTNISGVRVLMSMTDVTKMVNDAVANDTTGDLARARQEIISRIQRDKIGLPTAVMLDVADPAILNQNPFICEVVALYNGGQYHDYCYRVYNDIRLVFMPERNVGFFGGDADNFEYPRHTLDVSFLRAYENGKPAETPYHYLWSKSGATDGELVFAAGHPGSTKRMLTYEALKTERDVRAPFLLDLFKRRELTTQQFMIRSKKNRQVGESDLFSWQNSRKLYVGKMRGLQDSHLLRQKEVFENELGYKSSKDPILYNDLKEALTLVKDAQKTIREIYPKYILLVRGLGFDSKLFDYALSLFEPNPKIAGEVFQGRLVDAPINLEYEKVKIRDSLSHLIEVFGRDSEVVRELLNGIGSGPEDTANNLIYGTALSDINQHKNLVQADRNALGIYDGQYNDPMISLVYTIRNMPEREDLDLRWRGAFEKERLGYAKLNDTLFKLYGTDRYPDATFTLRLAFGTVNPVMNELDRGILPWTTIGGAYKHAADFDNSGDHKFPDRWYKRKNSVNLNTPLNFVSDLDITGGNSGSPVFNRNLEIVGVVFDSNLDGLASDYNYNYSMRARAISVHSAGIIEILSKIYKADRLVKELTGK